MSVAAVPAHRPSRKEEDPQDGWQSLNHPPSEAGEGGRGRGREREREKKEKENKDKQTKKQLEMVASF